MSDFIFENDELIIEYAGDTADDLVVFDSDEIENIEPDSEDIVLHEEPAPEVIVPDPFDYELLNSHFEQIHQDLFLIVSILIITFAKGCLRSWREHNVKEVR